MVFFYKKNQEKNDSFFSKWRKKISNPPYRLSKILVNPLVPFQKSEIAPPPPKKINPLPHPEVNIMNAALMEVQLYTEWDDDHVCIINQWTSWEVILHDGYYRWKNSPVIWKIIDNTALLHRYTLTKVSWRLTTIYLPTFSGSNAWDFRLAMIA